MKTKKFYLFVVILVTGILTAYVGYLSIFPFAHANTPVKRIWSSELKKTIQDISIAQNGSIIAIMRDSVAAINLDNGAEVWTVQLPSMSNPYPALIDNNVAFLLATDSLLALDAHDGSVLWLQPCECYYSKILDASDKYILVNYPSNSLDTYDATSGKFLWSLRAGRGFMEAYIEDNVIYVVDKELRAIDARTGNVIWEVGLELKGNTFFSNGKLFYEGGNPLNPNDTYIAAFDVHQHKELWQTSLDIQGFSHFLINEDNLFLSDQNHIYILLAQNGDLIWTAVSPDPTNMTTIRNNVLVLGNFTRTISALDLSSGRGRSVIQVDLPRLLGTERQDFVVSENMLIFAKGNSIYTYAYEK